MSPRVYKRTKPSAKPTSVEMVQTRFALPIVAFRDLDKFLTAYRTSGDGQFIRISMKIEWLDERFWLRKGRPKAERYIPGAPQEEIPR